MQEKKFKQSTVILYKIVVTNMKGKIYYINKQIKYIDWKENIKQLL